METPVAGSLRDQVQKWLAPELTVAIRVVDFGRLRTSGTRYVHVEILSPVGVRSMYFFRHRDRRWYVYPPTAGSLSAAVARRVS
jgi:hypothetical protein